MTEMTERVMWCWGDGRGIHIGLMGLTGFFVVGCIC